MTGSELQGLNNAVGYDCLISLDTPIRSPIEPWLVCRYNKNVKVTFSIGAVCANDAP